MKTVIDTLKSTPRVIDPFLPKTLLFRLLGVAQTRTWFFWGLQLVLWTALSVVMFLLCSIFKPNQAELKHVMLMRLFFGFLMTCILREVYRTSLLRNQQGWKNTMVLVVSCLVLTGLEQLITTLMLYLKLPIPGSLDFLNTGHPVILRLIVLLVWSGFYLLILKVEKAHALEMRALKAEVSARENRLRQLQAQMNPHFLFNALNTVLACKDDPVAVEEVTQNLADFLRFSLRETPELEPLALELDALETYLTVQRIRFGDNLICKIGCDTAARSVLVPPLLVQPLLENAFNYGAKTSPSLLQVILTAKLEAGFLVVTVANTGRWVSPGGGLSSGIGLSSVEQRLKILFGDEATVCPKADDGWVYVTVRIPMNQPLATESPRPS